MGGTDLMDSNISCYRVGIRSKKWYWPIFTYLIDAALQNAWTIYRKSGKNISLLEFRRSICQTYLTTYKVPAKRPGKIGRAAGSDFRVSDCVRFDCKDHWIISVPEGKRKRCAMPTCSSKGRTMCEKCNVGLCIACFKLFHTNRTN
uniref:PiggyBac transposable element-derived protein 2-like n=1 Tax=Diabrotica virgifera virgifera TaxID=50390 RepID=A0A6P7GSQ4_DIAVI